MLDEYQRSYFPARSPEFFCLELNGEAGELANLEKKRWKGREVPHERLAEEAADTLIALLNYSNSRGIDLAAAFEKKILAIERSRLERAAKGLEY